MAQHRNKSSESAGGGSFWKSRSGMALLAFFGVAGLLLAYEHRAHIVTSDGILIALLAVCIVVHFFMHVGHGGHGGGNDGTDGRGRS